MAWRRVLNLATSPELVQEAYDVDGGADGAEVIASVKAKLAALAGAPTEPTPN